ncbi:hypothetical protein DAPPUDRAFT_302125 [Daphnia pulex]|uniref:Ubiquitin-like domain-containing protein n=1 Tax=Daphnia pulex TaxID=6669 RepID=E9GBL9_DAPPU|nr:hypothetical protein DAPPUDRAFT_302125 [Daphnia pulex]|eukprot:EFX82980.1 hypothetical protein DAPPUDRAFT_302125 [Daphnia pulex]
MDNQTGLAFLSSVLDQMSYPNQILSPGQDDLNGIDVGVLHELLMKGCYIKGQDNTEETASNGRTILCSISPSAKVEDLMDMIRSKEGIPIELQRLIFQRTQLDNRKTLEDYNIKDESILHLVVKLRGGGICLPPSLLDEQFHYNFTKIFDRGVKFCRGGSIYIRPCGWQRYALKVKGKFPDDIWLDGKTPRADQYSSAEEEWPVSYHGTSLNNGLSIAEEGFKLSQGTRFLYTAKEFTRSPISRSHPYMLLQ